MKKLFLLLVTTVILSCSSTDVEPIVLTEESFSVELSNMGLFGTTNITAEANSDRTFLKIRAVLRNQRFIVEIGSESPDTPVLSEGFYSVNADGELVARLIYQNDLEEARTELGFFRSIEITSIDFESGIVSGTFLGLLSKENNDTIEATNGNFIGVFFSIEE